MGVLGYQLRKILLPRQTRQIVCPLPTRILERLRASYEKDLTLSSLPINIKFSVPPPNKCKCSFDDDRVLVIPTGLSVMQKYDYLLDLTTTLANIYSRQLVRLTRPYRAARLPDIDALRTMHDPFLDGAAGYSLEQPLSGSAIARLLSRTARPSNSLRLGSATSFDPRTSRGMFNTLLREPVCV
ncbi:hypothetical protein PENSPDRAFT_208832 [Peniophora sp. CONT]|nr:hypothetical protein PENSPDRAFT_208832 [Peniophora sp. CONT]